MADDFRAMKEARQAYKLEATPKRVEYAKNMLDRHDIDYYETESGRLTVDGYIDFWVFTGWWSGKGIGSGRGIHKLIKNIENNKE